MFVKMVLLKFIKDSGPQILLDRFQKAAPRIVTGMHAKGLTPETSSLKVLTRDALFRLWKSVLHSGDLSDLVRDHQDDKVVPLVEAGLNEEGKQSLAAIVAATARAAVGVTYLESN